MAAVICLMPAPILEATMNAKGTVAVGFVALLIGLGIGILGLSDFRRIDNPVISGVGNIDETVIADLDAHRIAELAVELDAAGPVTDEMLSESLNAVEAKAAGGDVEALSVLVEIARLQRQKR
jgi:hypothetical protein